MNSICPIVSNAGYDCVSFGFILGIAFSTIAILLYNLLMNTYFTGHAQNKNKHGKVTK